MADLTEATDALAYLQRRLQASQAETERMVGRVQHWRAEAERLEHLIDCAATPLMRDVMAERDRYMVALTEIIRAGERMVGQEGVGAEACAAIARKGLTSA